MCEELRFGAGCPMAAQRGGEVLWFIVWGCSASRCAFGSSFPQQSEQLQCETLGHLIFPPSDPNACLLHRDFLPDHSWGHIWTETHRSHPREGTRRTTVPWSCPPAQLVTRHLVPLPRQPRLGEVRVSRDAQRWQRISQDLATPS